MNDATRIVNSVEDPGDSANDCFSRVYYELRRLAAQKMANEGPGHTLQATALVHEAWLRLNRDHQEWQNRAHFFAAAAEAMRRILIESARRKLRLKRGGQFERMDLDEADIPLPLPPEDFLALDEALDRLTRFDERAARVVKLRFLAGLTHEQVAHELGISLSTVERLWSFARAWLFREMKRDAEIVKGFGGQERM